MPPLNAVFDSVVCINLRRHERRWRNLQVELERADWPLREVKRFDAIDGLQVPPPGWFRTGDAPSAWARLISHIRLWEDALNENVESILVFEDTVSFCDDFRLHAESFLENMPSEWDQLWLGGDHIPGTIPIRINAEVYRPEAVWRTHCYALRGRFIAELYEHIIQFAAPERFKEPADFYIDHQIAELSRNIRYRIYCPPRWIVGKRLLNGRDAEPMETSPVTFYNRDNPILNGNFRDP